MKFFLILSMIFIIISCSNSENTVLQNKINNYELKIVKLENDLKRVRKQLDNLCY